MGPRYLCHMLKVLYTLKISGNIIDISCIFISDYAFSLNPTMNTTSSAPGWCSLNHSEYFSFARSWIQSTELSPGWLLCIWYYLVWTTAYNGCPVTQNIWFWYRYGHLYEIYVLDFHFSGCNSFKWCSECQQSCWRLVRNYFRVMSLESHYCPIYFVHA